MATKDKVTQKEEDTVDSDLTYRRGKAALLSSLHQSRRRRQEDGVPCRDPTARLAYRCRVRRLCQKTSCFLQNVAEAKRRASIFDKGRKSSMAKAMEDQEEQKQLAAKSSLGMPSIRFLPASHLLLLVLLPMHYGLGWVKSSSQR